MKITSIKKTVHRCAYVHDLRDGRQPAIRECENRACKDCPYYADCLTDERLRIMKDALALIERMESERDAALAKVPRWISVKDRLPENEECVLVIAQYDGYFRKPFRTVMTAFHTNGKTIVGESVYSWEEGSVEMEYDEEADDFVVPEGWWEDVQCSDEFSQVDAKVTHWMQLPELPKEETK